MTDAIMRNNHATAHAIPKRGFTLIELLVVISIIGLLSSIVLVSINTARAKGRNARKQADLHQLSIALEQYYLEKGSAPANTAPTANWSDINTSLQGLVTGNYISRLPSPPDSTAYRYYDYGTYMLLATYLEPPAYGPGPEGFHCSDATGGSGSSKYYCINLKK